MAGVYLYAPTTPPPPPEAPPRVGLSVALRGSNGLAFDLTSSESGVRLQRGIRGFNVPPHTRWTTVFPGVPGSRRRGYHVDEREVSLLLYVYSNGTVQDWLDHDAAFWSIMQPDQDLYIDVTQPNGVVRTLAAVLESDNSQTWDMLPGATGWSSYNVLLVADQQPFWQGSPLTSGWTGDDGAGEEYESSPGDDFVLQISPNPSVQYAQMTNPGDHQTYPLWTLSGPMSSASVGTYDSSGNPRQITVAHALVAGETLTIDPRPTAQSAIYSTTGENWARDPAKITVADFDGSLIAPGATVNLATTISGEGAISAMLTPLYSRAW